MTVEYNRGLIPDLVTVTCYSPLAFFLFTTVAVKYSKKIIFDTENK